MPAPTSLEGPFPPGADPSAYDQERRRVLWSMPAGLYLLGSRAGVERNLMTASLVMQVAMSPKLVGASIETGAKTLELVRSGRCFSLSLLAKSDRAVVRKFVKPATADLNAMELNGFSFFDAPVSGAPVLSGALAYLDCRLEHEIELGSHHLVIGEVLDAKMLAPSKGENDNEDGGVLAMSDTRMSYGG